MEKADINVVERVHGGERRRGANACGGEGGQ